MLFHVVPSSSSIHAVVARPVFSDKPVTFLERDEGKQFFRVGLALISDTDEMSIKHKRGKVGDYSARYDNRRHKPLGHNSSSYE
jgi:hypothetical protein